MPTPIRHRGVAMVYASVFLVALLGVVSLAVDWGRVQTAKTEMQDAVDAAARYAAAGLYDNTIVVKAQQAASQNNVDGTTLAVNAADVVGGYWNVAARVFTAGATPRNAVRVVARRTRATGNAVPLYFGRLVGADSVDLTVTGIARQSSLAAVGIDAFALTGGQVRRKSTEGGLVTVATNGSPGSNLGTLIDGDVLYRVPPVLVGATTGRVSALPGAFAYAAATPPAVTPYASLYIVSNTNPVIGNYVVNGDVYVGGTANITLYGDTRIYVSGNTTLTGNMTVTTNGYRLFVYSTGNGYVTYSNNYALPVITYAPNSAVTFLGPGMISGSVVGKTLSINTVLEYAAASAIPAKPTGGGDAMSGGGVMTTK